MISVIIPVHNVEKYLSRCLDSVLANTYKDLEIILVENGSTDNSLKICRKFEKRYNNIKVIISTTTGLSHARNIGIDYASGDYIAFLDSDDYVSPNCYETLMNLSKRTGSDFTFCNFIMGNEESYDWKVNADICSQIISRDDYIFSTYIRAQYINSVVWNKLFHYTLLKNQRFDESLIYYEDREFITRVISSAHTICYSPVQLIYYYRGNENAISKQEDNNKRMYQIYSLEKEINNIQMLYPDKPNYYEYANACMLQFADLRYKRARITGCNDILTYLQPIIKTSVKQLRKSKLLPKREKIKRLLEHYWPWAFRVACRVIAK